MRKRYNKQCIRPLIFALVTLSFTAGAAVALDGQAELKLGYIYLDEDGYNRQHQSFNLYEGPVLSVEGMSYRFDDGSLLTGNLRNITLNNRNLNTQLTKSGLYGVSVGHSKFRRMYDSSPDLYTRRETSDATVWVKPHRFVRLFGGYGLTDKRGDRIDFFDVPDVTTVNQLDYQQERYHVGVRANERGRTVEAEFRRSEYTNNTDQSDTRISERFRTHAAFPIPRYEQVFISGGFQHYEYTVERDAQEISANTGWGALRWYFKQDFSVRYSFMFNRAERTQDLVATDNLTHAVYARKNWPKGGLTAGYRSSVRDDF
ncbi:MAG TPA: hypothetical protein VLB27_10450, partial [candidate division Zixibacteria bacterium]|nr:hypothetical protein [candidate division Zixibacteria bacterium]